LHTRGFVERQYSVAQAQFPGLGNDEGRTRERTGGLDEAAESQRHMRGSRHSLEIADENERGENEDVL
jgi:hypothetical protein